MDEIVLINLKQHVLAPDRIAVLLKSLMERQTAKSESADLRLLTLQRERKRRAVPLRDITPRLPISGNASICCARIKTR